MVYGKRSMRHIPIDVRSIRIPLDAPPRRVLLRRVLLRRVLPRRVLPRRVLPRRVLPRRVLPDRTTCILAQAGGVGPARGQCIC